MINYFHQEADIDAVLIAVSVRLIKPLTEFKDTGAVLRGSGTLVSQATAFILNRRQRSRK